MTTKNLLLVAYAPSPNTKRIVDACQQGFNSSESEQVNFKVLTPADTQPSDVMAADAIVLFTPENLAYMSGMMKDFFDRIYYPCLEETQGLPCAAIIRAGQGGGDGTQAALKSILTGLKWRWIQEPLILRGNWQDNFLEQAQELTMATALALDAGMI